MLNTSKQVFRWSGFTNRTNHAGHLIAIGELAGTDGITLPGLTLQIEIKAPVDVSRCLMLFSIMQLESRVRRPIYQLEVAPAEKRTHNGLEPIFGPHEHIGGNAPVAVANPDVSCTNWHATLRWFFTRTSVTPFSISDPRSYVEL